MDSFPETFGLKQCMEIIETQQDVLVKEIRQNFYDKVMEAAKKCKKDVELTFPENLWDEHRLKITRELVQKFGEIRVISIQDKAKSKRPISDPNDVPKNVDAITIQFSK